MMRFLTAGYAGHSPAEVDRASKELRAVVIDIRHTPHSRDKRWEMNALSDLLRIRYKHVPAWGNPNHHTGRECRIADYVSGFADMRTAMLLCRCDNAILLCGCRDASICHRTLLAQKLSGAGHEVSEMVWPVRGNVMKALSVRQPWVWAILCAGKPVENRTRDFTGGYRGPVLLHASSGMTRREYDEARYFVQSFAPEIAVRFPYYYSHPAWNAPASEQRGGIVGVFNLVDVVKQHPSPWFCGPYGFVIDQPRVLPFTPMSGTLGLWDVCVDDYPALKEAIA
jgi:hypothetical protein